jgi:hypothetical protein
VAREKAVRSGDATNRQLLRRLALAVEHTWGTDTKRYIDHEHYAPKDLVKYLDAPGYQTMEHSWQEKRDDIDRALCSRETRHNWASPQTHWRRSLTKHFPRQTTRPFVRLRPKQGTVGAAGLRQT